MLRYPKFLGFLKNIESLERLWIQFSGQWLEDRDTGRHCYMPLEGFRNISSLELYNFYGDEADLIDDVSNVLKDCPNLKTLGLGLACECRAEMQPEPILEGQGRFLERLCLRYGNQGKTNPLPLETLRLGSGLCLFESDSAATGNFLAKLVNLPSLKRLDVFNDRIKYD